MPSRRATHTSRWRNNTVTYSSQNPFVSIYFKHGFPCARTVLFILRHPPILRRTTNDDDDGSWVYKINKSAHIKTSLLCSLLLLLDLILSTSFRLRPLHIFLIQVLHCHKTCYSYHYNYGIATSTDRSF